MTSDVRRAITEYGETLDRESVPAHRDRSEAPFRAPTLETQPSFGEVTLEGKGGARSFRRLVCALRCTQPSELELTFDA
jgi:hypothetical protein